jgi:short-subunit dehydrogenase
MEDSKLVSSGGLMDAETVARLGYQGLMNNKTVVIPGLTNRLLTLVPRFMPRNMVTQAVRRAQEHEGGP